MDTLSPSDITILAELLEKGSAENERNEDVLSRLISDHERQRKALEEERKRAVEESRSLMNRAAKMLLKVEAEKIEKDEEIKALKMEREALQKDNEKLRGLIRSREAGTVAQPGPPLRGDEPRGSSVDSDEEFGAFQGQEEQAMRDRRNEQARYYSSSDFSSDTAQPPEPQGVTRMLYSTVGRVGAPVTKENKLKAELKALKKDNQKLSDAYKEARHQGREMERQAQYWHDEGYKAHMQLQALERAHRDTQDMVRNLGAKLAHTKQQLSNEVLQEETDHASSDQPMRVEDTSDTETNNVYAEARAIQEQEEQTKQDRELALALHKEELTVQAGRDSSSDSDFSSDTAQPPEPQGITRMLYSMVGGVSAPVTKEDKLKVELKALKKEYKKLSDAYNAACQHGKKMERDVKHWYDEGCRVHMELKALERAHRDTQDTLKSLGAELAHTKQQLSDAVNLSEVRGKELKVAHG